MNPKISVIIPNYNHSRYLPLRIESVLNQSFQDIEVIIMDDCSPDNSREIIANYAARDSRIKLAFNEQNSGSTFKQWNKGIALAKGEYIWIAESDDYAEPDFLATLLVCFEANPRTGLAYSQSFSVDEDGLPFSIGGPSAAPTWEPFYDELDPQLWAHDFTQPGIELVLRFMSFRNIIPNASAVLLRRSVLEQVGPADEGFKVTGDWLFWAKILSLSDVSFVARPLNYFRSHRNNVRTKTMNDGTGLFELTQMLATIKQYGTPDHKFYQKSIENLFGIWYHSFFYRQIPKSRHLAIYRNMAALEPGFSIRLLRAFRSILFRDNFSGIRDLVNDKLLNSFTKK